MKHDLMADAPEQKLGHLSASAPIDLASRAVHSSACLPASEPSTPMTIRFTVEPRVAIGVLPPMNSAALSALGGSGHRQHAAEHRPFEQPVEDRSPEWLAEWSYVDQQREHGEDRKRDHKLHPRLERLPPQEQPRRALVWVAHLSGIIFATSHGPQMGRCRVPWDRVACGRSV